MAKHGKKYRAAATEVDRARTYELTEAVRFMKAHPVATFDETAEIAFRMGLDPKKSDQAVRGTVTLPHGTGREVRVAVFADGPAAEAAREAGAEAVGFEDLLAKVQGGWLDFDVAVATPEAMREVRKLGKVLGPRGLMPNPKTGTVTADTAAAVRQCKAGRVEFRMDRQGNILAPFGRLSFSEADLAENAQAVIEAVWAAKPAAARGIYIKRCTVSSTMGPGLRIQVKEAVA